MYKLNKYCVCTFTIKHILTYLHVHMYVHRKLYIHTHKKFNEGYNYNVRVRNSHPMSIYPRR